MTNEPVRLRPIRAEERVAAIDILRGLAIFGILTVNAYYFSHPWFMEFGRFLELAGDGRQAGPVDRAVYEVVRFVANEMLYFLFAFLFAVGMATLMSRAQASGVPFVRLYVRRLLVLLAFGACHIVFLWSGDILNTYALLGFLLLLFRGRADSTLLAWSGACLSILVVGFAGIVLVTQIMAAKTPAAAPEPAPAVSTSPASATTSAPASAKRNDEVSFEDIERQWAAKTIETYKHGTYWQILRWRLADFALWAAMLIVSQYPKVFGMFLLGLWAGRRGILRDIPAHLPFIRKVAGWGTALGVAASLVAIVMRWYAGGEEISLTWPGLVAFAADAVRVPSLCLGLAAGMVLLVQQDTWRRLLSPLAAVGRMSLSNYLVQSVICAFIFYGYGLGLYGSVGPAGCLVLAVVIFLVQVPLSVLWLRYLRFGPAEWLWRTLTYGRPQPMRLARAANE